MSVEMGIQYNQVLVSNEHNSSVGKNLQRPSSSTDHFSSNQRKHFTNSIVQMNTDRHGTSTASLGSLFLWLTTLMVKKLIPVSSPNVPWCSFFFPSCNQLPGAELGLSLLLASSGAAESSKVTSLM